jgi:hypothetical protein
VLSVVVNGDEVLVLAEVAVYVVFKVGYVAGVVGTEFL